MFTREEIVVRLIEAGVPKSKAEVAADREVVSSLRSENPPKVRPRRAKQPASKALTLEQIKFRVWCKDNGLPMPTCEYTFAKEKLGRGWRMDFAWPDVDGNGGVYLEVDGGAWSGGRHTRGRGFIEDQEKRNAAVSMGWMPLHCTPASLYSPLLIEQISTALNHRSAA